MAPRLQSILRVSLAGLACVQQHVAADPGPSDYALLAPYRNGSAVLKPPATGAAVVALQNALAGCTYGTAENPLSGSFDANTTAALYGFQTHWNVTAADLGQVGAPTMAVFDTALGIAASPSPYLARITDAAVTPAITAGAVKVLNEYFSYPIGTEVPFVANGKTWVGRLELHFHPFNGTIKPWGYHHGVSVFCIRNTSCITGSGFLAATANMTIPQREVYIRDQLFLFNVPSWNQRDAFIPVTVSSGGHVVVFRVMPDYLSIGTDTDFIRVPTAAFTAQEVADRFNASLPTTKMVDLIWGAAAVRVAPQPIPPAPNMTSNAVFAQEQALIEAELAAAGHPPRTSLLSGDKKDIVVSNGYVTNPTSVCIYGWTQLNGKPIQPLYCHHAASYADYSHGVRLVDSTITVDGVPMALATLLQDPVLSAILSDEGPIPSPRIPTPGGR